MIKKIKVTNIKGIGENTENSEIKFDLFPNKPIIFVAPNGYGKSSLTIAFKSLNPTKIILDEEHCFKANKDNLPKIEITYLNDNNDETILTATNSSNDISNLFDCFVINNQIFAKAKKNRIGATVIASASLETPPIVLVNKIPEKEKVNYSITMQKSVFGSNGKILSNIGFIYNNYAFVRKIESIFSTLDKIHQVRITKRIEDFKMAVNCLSGTPENIKNSISTEQLTAIQQIQPIEEIVNILRSLDINYTSDADYYLAAIQILYDYKSNSVIFKKSVLRKIYEFEKRHYEDLFKNFNSSWKGFKPIEKDQKLIIEVPKATYISNGQRDIMCFIALLKKAEMKLNKYNNILIIDEVFDYLDDGNLIAVQFYVSQLIEKFKKEGKKIYPIILTHLNPYYFKNFVFTNQKIYFLTKGKANVTLALKNLLLKREEESIRDNVARFFLHYNPNDVNIRQDFEALGLKPTWGSSLVFNQFIEEEYEKYINNESVEFDPFAVCCAVRKKIEKKIYDQLNEGSKIEFIEKHKTPSKLKFAEDKGVIIPEKYYLLGIIYNDGLHWKDINEFSLGNKLQNLVIKQMIKEL